MSPLHPPRARPSAAAALALVAGVGGASSATAADRPFDARVICSAASPENDQPGYWSSNAFRLRIKGTVPESVTPGQTFTVGVTEVDIDAFGILPPPGPPVPAPESVTGVVTKLELRTGGATPASIGLTSPAEFGPAFGAYSGNLDPTLVTTPTGGAPTLAPVTAPADGGPVVLRLGQLSFSREERYPGQAAPVGSTSSCHEAPGERPFAVIPGTAPLPPAPVVTSVTPNHDPNYWAPRMRVTIKGDHLATTSSVIFDYALGGNLEVVDDHTIVVDSPKFYAAKVAPVIVYTDFGVSTPTPEAEFVSGPALPVVEVADVSPAAAKPGEVVRVTGTGLSAVATARVGDVLASISNQTDTELDVELPATLPGPTPFATSINFFGGQSGAQRVARSPLTLTSPDPSDTTAPSAPTPVAAVEDDVQTTSLALRWEPSADEPGGSGLYGYQVQFERDGVPTTWNLDADDETKVTLGGLVPSRVYTVRITAIDRAGNASAPLTISRTTKSLAPRVAPGLSAFAMTGSTTLRTLVKGTLPLTGSLTATAPLAAGPFTAALALAPTQGRLVAAGFLPVTAKLAFVPSGQMTGALTSGVLTAAVKVRIKVQEVKLFGAIPLGGGNSCQTRQLTDLALSSGSGFDPAAGGTLTGTYKISDLNGCGALNGLVSPLTAGGGNTITLKLAAKP